MKTFLIIKIVLTVIGSILGLALLGALIYGGYTVITGLSEYVV